MGDIFDQLTSQAKKPKGDIFDQVSAQQSPAPKPQLSPSDPNYSDPAWNGRNRAQQLAFAKAQGQQFQRQAQQSQINNFRTLNQLNPLTATMDPQAMLNSNAAALKDFGGAAAGLAQSVGGNPKTAGDFASMAIGPGGLAMKRMALAYASANKQQFATGAQQAQQGNMVPAAFNYAGGLLPVTGALVSGVAEANSDPNAPVGSGAGVGQSRIVQAMSMAPEKGTIPNPATDLLRASANGIEKSRVALANAVPALKSKLTVSPELQAAANNPVAAETATSIKAEETPRAQQAIHSQLDDVVQESGAKVDPNASPSQKAMAASKAVQAQGKPIYRQLDDASGGEYQRFQARIQQLKNTIRETEGIYDLEEVNKQAKKDLLNANNDFAIVKQKMIYDAKVDPALIQKADQLWTQKSALEDFAKKLQGTEYTNGDLKTITGLDNAIKNMNKNWPNRLEQAVGPERANAMRQAVTDARLRTAARVEAARQAKVSAAQASEQIKSIKANRKAALGLGAASVGVGGGLFGFAHRLFGEGK